MARFSPAPEDLAALSPSERVGFRIADFWQRTFWRLSTIWNATFTVAVTWVTVQRRMQVTGLDRLNALPLDRGIVFVANHRTFWDFFVITRAVKRFSKLSMRYLFPVRSGFFYSRPLGWFITGLMSGFTMFPPIKRGRGSARWNHYAIRRVIHELDEHRVIVGIHPEGRRYPDAEPFAVHPGQKGAARIAIEAENALVVPVFITGMTNDLIGETRRNWFAREQHPVFLSFGEPLDLAGLDPRAATDKMMAAIAEQAACCRALAAERRARTAELQEAGAS